MRPQGSRGTSSVWISRPCSFACFWLLDRGSAGPSASVCEAGLKAHAPLHLELLARQVFTRFLIQASYWKPSCIVFVLVKIACGPTSIESIPATPPATPALRQPGNKLNYLFLCCASFPLSQFTMLRRKTDNFPECCSKSILRTRDLTRVLPGPSAPLPPPPKQC